MSVIAGASPEHSVFEKLVECWRKHDISALSALFSSDFEYKVNGEVRFTDQVALRGYWQENKTRQQDLDIITYPGVLPASDGEYIQTLFSASFLHPARARRTIVFGVMRAKLSGSGQITDFDEHYSKVEYRHFLFLFNRSALALVQVVSQSASRIFGGALSILGTALNIFAFAMLGMVAYSQFLHPQLGIIGQSFVDNIKGFSGYFFAFMYLWLQLRPVMNRTSNQEIAVSALSDGQDKQMLSKEMKNADRVCILSGDFSFVSEEKVLEDQLKSLAFRRKLKFYSYLSEEEVRKGMLTSSIGSEIFTSLKDENNIVFNVPLNIKFTLIESGGRMKVLYKFTRTVNNKEQKCMAVIRPGERTSYIIQIFDGIFRSFTRTS